MQSLLLVANLKHIWLNLLVFYCGHKLWWNYSEFSFLWSVIVPHSKVYLVLLYSFQQFEPHWETKVNIVIYELLDSTDVHLQILLFISRLLIDIDSNVWRFTDLHVIWFVVTLPLGFNPLNNNMKKRCKVKGNSLPLYVYNKQLLNKQFIQKNHDYCHSTNHSIFLLVLILMSQGSNSPSEVFKNILIIILEDVIILISNIPHSMLNADILLTVFWAAEGRRAWSWRFCAHEGLCLQKVQHFMKKNQVENIWL